MFTDVKDKFQLNQAQPSLRMNVSYIIQGLQMLSLCKCSFIVVIHIVASSISSRILQNERGVTLLELTV